MIIVSITVSVTSAGHKWSQMAPPEPLPSYLDFIDK